ncbi:uncharacterized protein LOC132606136 isoform X2 [Lycium barbarum]|uniref:uncharacterized protein LOC132606136 isoform X2 n=1 Tax=Lycium barbarum TaxID=112863 RepID=UPI00293EBB0A|nr:uncharacterized protein LOC132606136 isoform X2 [Lycium barbarum]
MFIGTVQEPTMLSYESGRAPQFGSIKNLLVNEEYYEKRHERVVDEGHNTVDENVNESPSTEDHAERFAGITLPEGRGLQLSPSKCYLEEGKGLSGDSENSQLPLWFEMRKEHRSNAMNKKLTAEGINDSYSTEF